MVFRSCFMQNNHKRVFASILAPCSAACFMQFWGEYLLLQFSLYAPAAAAICKFMFHSFILSLQLHSYLDCGTFALLIITFVFAISLQMWTLLTEHYFPLVVDMFIGFVWFVFSLLLYMCFFFCHFFLLVLVFSSFYLATRFPPYFVEHYTNPDMKSKFYKKKK